MYQTIKTKLMTVKESTSIAISIPEAIKDACQDIAELAQESFQILTLNARNLLIERHMITLGIADACLVHPREVFRAACQDSACAIILIHNHPSGDVTPSSEDMRITKQLIEAGKIMDIKILDHVIIGKQKGDIRILSFREEGIYNFSS